MNDRKKNLLENRFSDRSIHLIRPFTQSELSDKIDMGLYPNTSHSQPAPQSLFNNTTQFLRRKNMNHEVAPKKSKNDLNGLNFKMFGMPPPNTDSTQDTDSKLQNTNSGLSDFSISTPDSWSMGEFDKHVQTSLTCLKMQHIENNKIAELEEKNDRINVLQEKILECDSLYTKQKEDMECLSQKHKQMNEIIVDLLINKSKVERNNDETKTNLKMLSLGHFTMQRCGSSFQEKWIEGSSFIKLYGNQKSLKKERENFEKEKKSILKRKPQYISQIKTNSRESSSKESGLEPKMENELSWDEYYEYENILKLRLMSLRKEELDLQIELDRLDRDRNVHIREIRRLKNQANSEFNDYPFLNERYLLLNLLGKGGFSEVYMAFDTKDNIYTACKIHQLNKDWKEEKKSNYIRHALREADIHKKLNHKRIVGLLEVFELDNNSFCTILEYCDGHDLDFYLKQNKTCSEKEGRSIIIQVISALKYLSGLTPPVIHYDLKPGNILLCNGRASGEIKITDFGLSKIMTNDNDHRDHSIELTSQGAGTYWYLPPECFMFGKNPPKISSKVDVWSVGVIYYQCLIGKKPFGHYMSQNDILEQNVILKAKAVDFPNKPVISNEAKAFIRRCLVYDKDYRADVKTLFKDDYLRQNRSLKSVSKIQDISSNLIYDQM